jgi:hypothetical protein
MASCRMVDLLYAAVPLRPFRGLLIRTHVDKCARCQARLVSRSEAGALFVKFSEVGETGELGRRFALRAGKERPGADATSAPIPRRWEWAAGAATLLLAAAASFWLLRGIGPEGRGPGFVEPGDRFEINHISVGGAPAQAYVYRPQNSDMIIVWAEKSPG